MYSVDFKKKDILKRIRRMGKKTIKWIPNKMLLFCLRYLYVIWRMKNRECDARKWSNDELGKIAPIFKGSVLNVSAGEDKDKEGGVYKNYFYNASSYIISNYKKVSNCEEQLEIDLSIPLTEKGISISPFDVVYTHTVLEHVYQIDVAIENLCKLSNDITITIMPFLQCFHSIKGLYGDYWRVTPYALVNMFKKHCFETVYISWSNDFLGNIYLFHIASKKPQQWQVLKERCRNQRLAWPGAFRQMLLSNSHVFPISGSGVLEKICSMCQICK